MEQLIIDLLRQGQLSLPKLFIKHYKEIGLTDEEMMLVIQILSFKQDGNEFPTIAEILERMTVDEREMMRMLQKLVQQGYLEIMDRIEPGTGVRAEAYQLDPLYAKIAEKLVEQEQAKQLSESKPVNEQNLFVIFEQEFGRPLSPIECESIAMWQDQDQYKDELIIAALREAVISNKMFIRYIDKILYEWQRNRIETVEQAREFSLKFRRNQPSPSNNQRQTSKSTSKPEEPEEAFPFYNWLEN